ncbi:hypothetical protein [Spiroplasma endosymbiont of Virgichneumon dumeticola]|uniref:hypothetical protein n=1 Tax=Spiroplasma endosymbiont of Virgichneumon dumeticola TaxID=3139323 RepID=UPI0035C8E788
MKSFNFIVSSTSTCGEKSVNKIWLKAIFCILLAVIKILIRSITFFWPTKLLKVTII